MSNRIPSWIVNLPCAGPHIVMQRQEPTPAEREIAALRISLRTANSMVDLYKQQADNLAEIIADRDSTIRIQAELIAALQKELKGADQ